MKVQFRGKMYTWALSSNPRENPSKGHLLARELLEELYPSERRLEEVPLPGTRLFVDFFLPSKRLLVEVQGEQHSEFVPHFHKNMLGFWKGRQRDSIKREFAQENDFYLVELGTDDIDCWRAKLTDFTNSLPE